MQKNLFIGVMSGTSSDGLDIVLCKITPQNFIILNSISKKYSSRVKQDILKLNQSSFDDLESSKAMGYQISKICIPLISQLLDQKQLKSTNIQAIGFHGPTIRHQPNKNFSIQIGNEFTLAEKTNIPVVHDFRNMDIANGGQGAPLIPLFHKYLLNLKGIKKGIFLNLGGFANLTIIDHQSVTGFDTGPGNIFLDLWIKKCLNKNFDQKGVWAKSGKIIPSLLQKMLNDPYFRKKTPKSTGRDYFNEQWLQKFNLKKFNENDIQRTLLELTLCSIQSHLKKLIHLENLFICGGGTFNTFLIEELAQHTQLKIKTTENLSINPQLVEACGFAWLAQQRVSLKRLNYQKITGSRKNHLLGVIVHP